MKELAHEIGCNSHPTTGILDMLDANVTDLKQFNTYGQLSESEITTYATMFVDSDTMQMENKYQLYHLLNNSLNVSEAVKIISDITKYQIVSNPCADLISKLLIHKSIIKTMDTASNMRENLSSLDAYISTVNPDIEKFNEYANINYEALSARGERCDVMMSNQLNGFVVAWDKAFLRYIQHQKYKYDNGYILYKDNLMTLVLNKDKNMCTKVKCISKSPE